MRRALGVAIAMALLSIAPRAQEGFSIFTTDFPPDEFATRRARIYDAIGNTGLALLQGAPSPVGYTRFRQSNEFYYLSGIEVPHAYLLLDAASKSASLYLPHRNERREASEGRLLSAEDADEVKRLSGIDAVYGVDLLGEHLARAARRRQQTLFTPMNPAEGIATSRDLALRAIGDRAGDPFDGTPSREGAVRANTPRPLSAAGAARPVADTRRDAADQDATRIDADPTRHATRRARLDGSDAVDGTGHLRVRTGRVGEVRVLPQRRARRGVLLADCQRRQCVLPALQRRQAADARRRLPAHGLRPGRRYYMSDITRMMPVNGRFSPWQRELYSFYLGCYTAVLDAIRPNVTAQAVAQSAVPTMDTLLAASTFSKPIYRNAAARLVAEYRELANNPRGSLGHWVGMATHDVGTTDGPLRAGMVFTIEPALVVPEEKIYVRLEDLIIITDTAKDVPSAFVPDGNRCRRAIDERSGDAAALPARSAEVVSGTCRSLSSATRAHSTAITRPGCSARGRRGPLATVGLGRRKSGTVPIFPVLLPRWKRGLSPFPSTTTSLRTAGRGGAERFASTFATGLRPGSRVTIDEPTSHGTFRLPEEPQ